MLSAASSRVSLTDEHGGHAHLKRMLLHIGLYYLVIVVNSHKVVYLFFIAHLGMAAALKKGAKLKYDKDD